MAEFAGSWHRAQSPASQINHPEPDVEEEEAMYLSWRHPMATNEVGSIDPPYNMVTPIRGGHE